MQVRDVMTADPTCCTRDSRLADVARIMVKEDCGAVPVTESRQSQKVVGIVTDRDIVCRAVAEDKNPLELTAESCMSTHIVTAVPETSLEECCQQMEQNQVRRVVVVDQQGKCCGIVAQADVATHAGEQTTAETVKEVSRPTQSASAN